MDTQYDNGQLPLSDHLAIDRTVLANGRTFLAYVRTALALFIIGITFTHFLEPWYFPIIGVFLNTVRPHSCTDESGGQVSPGKLLLWEPRFRGVVGGG